MTSDANIKRCRPQHYDPQFRQLALTLRRESGLDAAAFCRREGINPKAFVSVLRTISTVDCRMEDNRRAGGTDYHVGGTGAAWLADGWRLSQTSGSHWCGPAPLKSRQRCVWNFGTEKDRKP